MVFSIANIYEMDSLSKNVTQSLRMMKLSFLETTVDQPNFPVTYYMNTLHRIFTHYYNPIVCAIRDNQKIVC